MKLLALDTSTEACSVALHLDSQIHSLVQRQPRAQARLILPMITQLVNECGVPLKAIDALAFGCGPGSFTGLRIACGVIQGLALALDKPVIPISTLATMAQQLYQQQRHTHVLSALDARMSEVYWAAYTLNPEQGLMQVSGADRLSAPNAVKRVDAGLYTGVGSAWQSYQEILTAAAPVTQCYPEVFPQAEYMLPLAQAAYEAGALLSAEQAQPVYLRNQVAETTAERLQKQKKQGN